MKKYSVLALLMFICLFLNMAALDGGALGIGLASFGALFSFSGFIFCLMKLDVFDFEADSFWGRINNDVCYGRKKKAPRKQQVSNKKKEFETQYVTCQRLYQKIG